MQHNVRVASHWHIARYAEIVAAMRGIRPQSFVAFFAKVVA
jgi:hypothetical protein